MDHTMEERKAAAAEAAIHGPRPKRPSQENWPKEKGTATLCPLRIQDDDC